MRGHRLSQPAARRAQGPGARHERQDRVKTGQGRVKNHSGPQRPEFAGLVLVVLLVLVLALLGYLVTALIRPERF